MHGGLLSYKEWTERLDAVDEELNSLRPPETPGFEGGDLTQVDPELLDDATQIPDESPSKAPRVSDEWWIRSEALQ
jgi:condensin complex subunit 1